MAEREYFNNVLNGVTITPPDTHKGHLAEENTITAADVFLAVNTLQAGKAADCNGIRLEMLKALNRGVIWLTRMCQVNWCLCEGTEVLSVCGDCPHTHK